MTALGAALLLAAPAAAQLPVDETGATIVEELVARPLSPGPAWWRVADEDSSVWIMSLVQETPAGFAWDRTVMERRMYGANLLIKPFDLSLVDPRSILGASGLLLQVPFMLGGGPKRPKPNPVPLEQRLAPDISARFVSLRESLGQPAERYAPLEPLDAMRLIERDFRDKHPRRGGEVFRQIEATAKRNGVRTVAAYKVRIPSVKMQRISPTRGKEAECLDRALVSLPRDYERMRRSAYAWARGDTRTTLFRAESPMGGALSCSYGVGATLEANSPLARRLDEEFVAGQVATLERALKTPGRSIAVLPVESPAGHLNLGLLGTNGVLARLKARGYEITAPPGLEGK